MASNDDTVADLRDLGLQPEVGLQPESGLDPEVGLDDLLFGQPGPRGTVPAAPEEPTRLGRWLLGRTFFAVAAAAAVYGVLYLLRLTIPYPLLVVVIFVVTLLKFLLGRISPRPLPAELTGRGIRPMDPGSGTTGDQEPARDGIDLAVGRWAARLNLAGRIGGGFGKTVVPRLGELVDERLRLRHGCTRASDPARAREMMGEHLWRMLHDPSVGVPTPRDMALVVTRIEEL